jgi:hypothetical protein
LLAAVSYCQDIAITRTNQHKGTDGVRLWNIRTQAQLSTPNQPHVQRGQVSCVLWVTHSQDTEELLCYGTGLGYIVFWRQKPKRVSFVTIERFAKPDKIKDGFVELNAQRIGTGLEITCIANDPFSESEIRVIVGMRGMLVQVWQVDARAKMRTVFSVQLDKTVPKAVAFAENSEDVHVFGLYDGNV